MYYYFFQYMTNEYEDLVDVLATGQAFYYSIILVDEKAKQRHLILGNASRDL